MQGRQSGSDPINAELNEHARRQHPPSVKKEKEVVCAADEVKPSFPVF